MKPLLFFALIGLAFSAVLGVDENCNPDGDGKPNCTQLGIYRNNWDPVHYWQCDKINAEPSLVPCPSMTLFHGEKNVCVPIKQWEWIPPCPEAE